MKNILQSFFGEMFFPMHHFHDLLELHKLVLLVRTERKLREERQNRFMQIIMPFDNINPGSVSRRCRSIALDQATIQAVLEKLQYRNPLAILTDMELRNHLNAECDICCWMHS